MGFNFSTVGECMDDVEHEAPAFARGRALENLVAVMAGAISGVRVAARNVIAESRVEELDLLLVNHALDDELIGFSYDLAVESKTQGRRC